MRPTTLRRSLRLGRTAPRRRRSGGSRRAWKRGVDADRHLLRRCMPWRYAREPAVRRRRECSRAPPRPHAADGRSSASSRLAAMKRAARAIPSRRGLAAVPPVELPVGGASRSSSRLAPYPAPGTEDYIQTAVLVPALFHIHEALTEALVKQTPGAVLTDTGSALRLELAAHPSCLTAGWTGRCAAARSRRAGPTSRCCSTG